MSQEKDDDVSNRTTTTFNLNTADVRTTPVVQISTTAKYKEYSEILLFLATGFIFVVGFVVNMYLY